MSNKTFKRARKRIKPIYSQWNIALVAGMKIPLKIRFFGLFKKQIKTGWVLRWTRENQRMMRVAMNKLSHELEKES